MISNFFRTLNDPCLYVFVDNEPEICGVTTFWEVVDESLWNRTEQLNPDTEKLMATVVLDLPSFEGRQFYDAYGIIAYFLDDKQLQTVVPTFRLDAIKAIDGSYVPRYNADSVENTILAIKAGSVEKIIEFKIEDGSRLVSFLENEKGFHQMMYDVFALKTQESYRHCILEILPVTEISATIRVSAP